MNEILNQRSWFQRLIDKHRPELIKRGLLVLQPRPVQVPSRRDPSPGWLSTDQIRRRVRVRWQTVADAMESGDLPSEQRGRGRWARLSDIEAWEARLVEGNKPSAVLIHSDLVHLLGQ